MLMSEKSSAMPHSLTTRRDRDKHTTQMSFGGSEEAVTILSLAARLGYVSMDMVPDSTHRPRWITR